jgi:PhoPQ-activated pathogenicity-related protein
LTGGNNRQNHPGVNPEFGLIASMTNSIVAIVHQIPNQPIVFANETKGRFEDDLISYSWRKFWHDGDLMWIVNMAMVKSASQCLNAGKNKLLLSS